MVETMNIVELLGKIKSAKSTLDNIYESILYPPEQSRSLVSLSNKSSNRTINGASVEDVTKEIIEIDTSINKALSTYQKLLMVKEQVNTTNRIVVPSMVDHNKTMPITVAQALVIKTDYIKKYINGYMAKKEHDLKKAIEAREKYQESITSSDKLDRYVHARINSDESAKTAEYNVFQKYSEEYLEATSMDLLDPLNIKDTVLQDKHFLIKFYEILDRKLLEFNVSTKIWIDLEKDDEYFNNCWGYAKIMSTKD